MNGPVAVGRVAGGGFAGRPVAGRQAGDQEEANHRSGVRSDREHGIRQLAQLRMRDWVGVWGSQRAESSARWPGGVAAAAAAYWLVKPSALFSALTNV